VTGEPEVIFRVGDVLSDVYEIRGVLGEGGNGQVFEAFDRLLQRRVAIKAQWPSMAKLGPFLRNEARALAAVRHPSLVTVHAMGTHAGSEYLVMELVSGVSLAAYLDRRIASGERVGLHEALDILVAVAEGLAAVHRAGIAHRDVKPANVMLAPPSRVVLADFGLVVPEFAAGTPDLHGTPEYMAPETIQGEISPGTAHLVDTYALGVLAFELFTGRVPYESESFVEVTMMHVDAPIPELPGVPRKVAALVHEMMAKDPLARPQQIESVVWRLRALKTSEVSIVPPKAFDVVVVDDQPDIAKLMAMYVKSAVPSADVAIATSAKQALELVRQKSPSLMIVDLMMPEMTGVELYMYLRGERLAERSTVVAVSAGAGDADVAMLYELGVAHFVEKGTELRRRISEIAKEVFAVVGARL
jgi:serine/threonine-protein kinase